MGNASISALKPIDLLDFFLPSKIPTNPVLPMFLITLIPNSLSFFSMNSAVLYSS